MPRFSLKTMLVATAVVALWLSTAANFAKAADVRDSIILIIFLSSAFAAICFRGRERMFWAGFFVVLLLTLAKPFDQLLINVVPSLIFPSSSGQWVNPTIRMAWILILAVIVGSIAAYIYDQSRKTDDK